MANPLPSQGMEDFVAWSLTKMGTFSVRSVYFAEWESQFGHKVNRGEEAGPMKDHQIWEIIWKLRVPSKVRIYIWRIMQETIPCRVVWVNRHIKVSAQCPLCAEDVKHMLF